MAITARFGVEPFPFGVTGPEGYRAAAVRVVRAGADSLSYALAWDEFETAEGVYATTILGWLAGGRGSAKFQVTIAVLDYTGAKNLPAYLVGEALDSAAVMTGFHGVIDALHTLLGDTGLDILVLGNEVENYLSTHAAEITPFANLIGDAETYAQAKSGWSSVQVTASFRHDTPNVAVTYAAIIAASTKPAFTYYPINNVTYAVNDTDPDTIGTTMFNDLLALPTAVGSTVILTEMGFPSHVDLGSSAALQAAFYGNACGVVQAIADFDGIYSAQYQWLTEWPDWLLDLLGFTGNARKFVGTLGLVDVNNREKPAWDLLVAAMGGTTRAFSSDGPTRMAEYLRDYYNAEGGDATTHLSKYLARFSTGEMTARFKAVQASALEETESP